MAFVALKTRKLEIKEEIMSIKEENEPKKKRKVTITVSAPIKPVPIKPVVKIDKPKESKPKGSPEPNHFWISTIIIVLLIAIMIVVVTNCVNTRSLATTTTATVAETTAETTAKPTPVDDAVTKANQILLEAGWKTSDYNIGSAVDLSKDKSTGAAGAFSKKVIKTVPEMLNFLKSDEASAIALLKQIMKKTDATAAEVMDDKNWVAVQSLVKFSYPGNTTYKNGNVIGAGSRKGSAGDIFFIFISPSSDKFIFVRGGCANPQTVVPTKTTTTVSETTAPETTAPETSPPTTLQEKNSTQDPAAQGNAPVGGGVNQDTGPGNYIDQSKMEQPPDTAHVNPVAPQ